jgi:hypothetical protein
MEGHEFKTSRQKTEEPIKEAASRGAFPVRHAAARFDARLTVPARSTLLCAAEEEWISRVWGSKSATVSVLDQEKWTTPHSEMPWTGDMMHHLGVIRQLYGRREALYRSNAAQAPDTACSLWAYADVNRKLAQELMLFSRRIQRACAKDKAASARLRWAGQWPRTLFIYAYDAAAHLPPVPFIGPDGHLSSISRDAAAEARALSEMSRTRKKRTEGKLHRRAAEEEIESLLFREGKGEAPPADFLAAMSSRGSAGSLSAPLMIPDPAAQSKEPNKGGKKSKKKKAESTEGMMINPMWIDTCLLLYHSRVGIRDDLTAGHEAGKLEALYRAADPDRYAAEIRQWNRLRNDHRRAAMIRNTALSDGSTKTRIGGVPVFDGDDQRTSLAHEAIRSQMDLLQIPEPSFATLFQPVCYAPSPSGRLVAVCPDPALAGSSVASSSMPSSSSSSAGLVPETRSRPMPSISSLSSTPASLSVGSDSVSSFLVPAAPACLSASTPPPFSSLTAPAPPLPALALAMAMATSTGPAMGPSPAPTPTPVASTARPRAQLRVRPTPPKWGGAADLLQWVARRERFTLVVESTSPLDGDGDKPPPVLFRRNDLILSGPVDLFAHIRPHHCDYCGRVIAKPVRTAVPSAPSSLSSSSSSSFSSPFASCSSPSPSSPSVSHHAVSTDGSGPTHVSSDSTATPLSVPEKPVAAPPHAPSAIPSPLGPAKSDTITGIRPAKRVGAATEKPPDTVAAKKEKEKKEKEKVSRLPPGVQFAATRSYTCSVCDQVGDTPKEEGRGCLVQWCSFACKEAAAPLHRHPLCGSSFVRQLKRASTNSAGVDLAGSEHLLMALNLVQAESRGCTVPELTRWHHTNPDPPYGTALDAQSRYHRYRTMIESLGCGNHPLLDLAWYDALYTRVSAHAWRFSGGVSLIDSLTWLHRTPRPEDANCTVEQALSYRPGAPPRFAVRALRDIRHGEPLVALLRQPDGAAAAYRTYTEGMRHMFDPRLPDVLRRHFSPVSPHRSLSLENDPVAIVLSFCRDPYCALLFS